MLAWEVGAYVLVIAFGFGGLKTVHDAQVVNCQRLEALKKPQFAEITAEIKDLRYSVRSSRRFLRENPHGLLGFKRQDILDNINQQLRTIDRKVLNRANYAPKGCS